ncbi:15104_t:CDS:10, partial [Gigaspora rosea]
RNNYSAYGQTFQPAPQPQQTPAVLHAGLPTHGATASQFNAFTPLSNYSSRFSGDLRAGYGAAHISSHQSQIQQQTQQQHLSWQNKNWSAADLSTSGGTNSQASHGGNMMTGNLYGTGGASGSNANSGLYAGGHNQQPSMAASLSAFHTSPTPAPQQPHNTTHNNSMISLPSPNSSSSVTSSLMRQQLYPMDTSNNIGLGNMSSIASMGGSLQVGGFQRHDANLSHFAVVDDAVSDLDTDSLMDNQMVTTTLASNTSSTQTSISPNNQQNYMNSAINSRTSINSITNSAAHSTVSPSVNGSITTPKRHIAAQQQPIHNRSSIGQNPTPMKSSPLITKPSTQKSIIQSGVSAQQSQQSQQSQQLHQQHHSQQQQQSQSSSQSSDMQLTSQSKTTPKMVRNTIAGGNTPSQQQQPSSFPQTNVAAQAKPSKNAPVNTTPTPLPKTTNSLPPQDVKNQDITSNIPQTKDQKPKRPMNAFIIFSSERRPELQKNDPNMQTAQVSKILGEEWQNMDSTRKDHYNERARQLKEEFKQSNPDFVYTRRGTAAAAKKRGSTSSATPSVKSPADTIAVPPQATNVPIPNGSVNGVTSHNSNNVYTSPHQHTPTSSSTPTQQQRSTPAATTQQSTTTPQPQLRTPQTIGSTTPVSSARRDRKLRRPMNAFLIFNKEMRPKVLEMNPNMSVAEISKTIGENWRNMSEEERERYLQKARDLKSEFHETHPDFVYTRRSKAELIAAGHHSYSKKRSFPQNENSDSEEEPRSSHVNNPRDGSPATSPQKDPRGRKKKRSRHPTAPKHPMSGFLFYALEMRPHVAEQNPGSTVGPISKIIAGHWKNLTPEQRAPWEKKASDDKARYAREMEQYLQSQKDDE